MATIERFEDVKAWQTAREQDEFEKALHQAEDLSKMISRLMDYLNNCEIKGSKYKH